MRFYFLILLVIASVQVKAQKNFMIGSHLDVIKTVLVNAFDKMQGDLEINYFLTQKFSVNTGIEFRSNEKYYLTIGARKYILSFVYLRARVLENSDDRKKVIFSRN